MPFSRRTALSASAAAGECAVFLRPFRHEREQPRLKMGQIGVGHAHATKLQVYRESPDYEVVGLVEPTSCCASGRARQPVGGSPKV